jgi:tetratricopeptide (TPR) repeat protein
VAMVLNSLGGVLQRQGKFDEAVDVFRRSYDLLLEMRDRRGQAMVLNSLGGALHRRRKYDEAGDAFRRSIAIGDELGDQRHLAMVHTAYGNALLKTDRQAAAGELRKGFEIDAALKNRKGVGIVAPVLVDTLVKLGRIGEAREICDRALTIIPEDTRLLALRRELDQRGGST